MAEDSNQEDEGAWAPDYQGRDWAIVDYQEYHRPGISSALRGPASELKAGQYFTCMGAAQTFGVFVSRPYPALLACALGLPVLNLGLPAAGPGFYAHQDAMLELANNGRFVVLQVMAARAEANRYYDAEGYCETVRDRSSGKVVSAFTAWKRLSEERSRELADLIQETRRNWIASYELLAKRLRVPVLLAWISHERRHTEIMKLDGLSFDELYFRFPQLVDATCLPAIRTMFAGFVACESRRNVGHALVSRFDGSAVAADNGFIHRSGKRQPKLTHNDYYPSPEMHEDIAGEMLGALRSMDLASVST